jgi:hypothetical protein
MPPAPLALKSVGIPGFRSELLVIPRQISDSGIKLVEIDHP